MGWLTFFAVITCFSLHVAVGSMAGGWNAADSNGEIVQGALRRVTTELSQKPGGPCEGSLQLLTAETQVVAGRNIRLTFRHNPANCTDGSNSGGVGHQERNCTVVVWEKPWEQFSQITDDDCTVSATQRKMIGGGDHDVGNMGMFKKFVKKYNKQYRNDKEFVTRFKIFRENMRKVKKLQESERGTGIYGATQFADLSEEEFRRYHLGLKPELASRRGIPASKAVIPNIEIPDAYDWRAYNVVTTIKNQGMCGSCWAFSVTGNIEGQWAIQEKRLLSLSEQELVDCDKVDQGCEGGYMTNAYDQIIKLVPHTKLNEKVTFALAPPGGKSPELGDTLPPHRGLETETDYPYDGMDEQCQFTKSKAQVTIRGYVNISSNETDMAKWLIQNGPISIGINANAMQFYFGGISHPWKFLCNPSSIDHGVLIVGYGITNNRLFKKNLPYWIVKNSWGKYWGEQGYYRVYRGDGTCGLNLMPSSAVVD